MLQKTMGATGETKLSLVTCMGFGVGSVGVSILLNTVSTFFPALMTTVLGQSAAVAGLLLTGSKIYDAFCDMTVGAVSDRVRSKIGRRRPFFLYGAVVSALSLLMIFVPPTMNGLTLSIYMGVALLVYSTGYSLFSVPYLAMSGEMTGNYHERTRLMSFRVFFIAIGQVSSVAGTAWLIATFGKNMHGYAVMGVVMAAATAAVMLASYFGTAKAPFSPPPPKPTMPFGERMKMLAANRPLVLLIGSKFAQYVSIAVASTTKLLFMLNVLKIGYEGIVQLSLAQNLFQAACVPLWLMMARRVGKKAALIVAHLVLIGAYMSWLLTGPGITVFDVWLRGALTGIGGGGVVLMGVAMLPDAMELDRQRTGLQREGTFSGLYAIVEKGAYAVGPAIIGVYLALVHYTPTTHGRIIQQPIGAVHALYAGATVIPAGLLVISLLLVCAYNLSESDLARGRLAAPAPEAAA